MTTSDREWYLCDDCLRVYCRIDLLREPNKVCDWCHYIGDGSNVAKLSKAHTKRRTGRVYRKPLNKESQTSPYTYKRDNNYVVLKYGVKLNFSITKLGDSKARKLAGFLQNGIRHALSGEEVQDSVNQFLINHPECIGKTRFLPSWVEYKQDSSTGKRFFRIRYQEKVLKSVYINESRNTKQALLEIKKARDILVSLDIRIKRGDILTIPYMKRSLGVSPKLDKELPQGAHKCGIVNRYYLKFWCSKKKKKYEASIQSGTLDDMYGEDVPVLLEEIRENAEKFSDNSVKKLGYIKYRFELIKNLRNQKKFESDFSSQIKWHGKHATDIVSPLGDT
jgi:hypothetical protein